MKPLPDDPARATARQILDAVRDRRWTVTQVAMACLARIAARDSDVHAWSHVDGDRVLKRAHALDRARTRGPLHGVPIGIKDVFLTRDMPTRYNSPAYKTFHPSIDAACITTLRHAGALLVGKTQTVEFGATGAIPSTRNPHNLARTPGGSSSGSAAAVADFHVPLALGTQTGGSLMRPASFCGVYAMKPTWGAVCREGVKTYADSLDTVGWFARTPEDLGLFARAFGVAAVQRPLSLRGARIALCRTPMWHAAEPATRTAFEHVERSLADAGATITLLELPSTFAPLADAHLQIMRAEGGVTFLSESALQGKGLHPSFRDQIAERATMPRHALRDALDTAAACRIAFDALAAPFDAVIAPSATGEAPPGLESTGAYIFNGLWTALHVPCINVPATTGPNGLPVGVTVVGGRYEDGRVLSAAQAIGATLAM